MRRAGKPKAIRPARKSKEDLTQKAYNALCKMLLFNEIAVGQKIHYLDLAEKLRVSPTPVIQALKWLQFQGLVRHENNRGFYLEDISLDEVEQLYQMRSAVELTLLNRTMNRRDNAGLALLRASLEAFLQATQTKFSKQILVKDMEFHLTLASLSGGRTGCLILQHIFDLLYLKYRTDLLYLNPSYEVHKKVFDCIVARDFEGARDTLSRHLSKVTIDVLALIRLNQEEKKTLELDNVQRLKIGGSTR